MRAQRTAARLGGGICHVSCDMLCAVEKIASPVPISVHSVACSNFSCDRFGSYLPAYDDVNVNVVATRCQMLTVRAYGRMKILRGGSELSQQSQAGRCQIRLGLYCSIPYSN